MGSQPTLFITINFFASDLFAVKKSKKKLLKYVEVDMKIFRLNTQCIELDRTKHITIGLRQFKRSILNKLRMRELITYYYV